MREFTTMLGDLSERQRASETNVEAQRTQATNALANTVMAGLNQMAQNQQQSQMAMMRMFAESQERSFQFMERLVQGLPRQPRGRGRQAKASDESDEDEE